MQADTHDPLISELRDAISYCPDTGIMTWRIFASKRKPGDHAGAPDGHGYLHVGFKGRKYCAHRMAWAIYYGRWPLGVVDHINGVTTDNRIVNLREATVQQNSRYQGIARNNKTGFKGVSSRASGRFAATIYLNGKNVSLGVFGTKIEAALAYDKAARLHYGEFAYVNLR